MDFRCMKAARIALRTVAGYLKRHPEIESVRFVLFGKVAYDIFVKELGEMGGESG